MGKQGLQHPGPEYRSPFGLINLHDIPGLKYFITLDYHYSNTQQDAVLYTNAWYSGVERKYTLHCALASVFAKIWGNDRSAPSSVHMSRLLWSFINFGDIQTYFLVLFRLKYLHSIFVTVACTYGVISRQSLPSYEPVSLPRLARNLWISERVGNLHPIPSSYRQGN